MVLLPTSAFFLRAPPYRMDFAVETALLGRHAARLSFYFRTDRHCPPGFDKQIAGRIPRFPSLAAKSRLNHSHISASFSADAQNAEPGSSWAGIVGARIHSLVVLALSALLARGVLVISLQRAIAADSSVAGVSGSVPMALRGAWPKVMQVLLLFKDQGLVLTALLGLSAFFSMAETSITTLWPWKVRELAEKEPENGVFKMLRSDVTRFLTTILIGTTVVNIGATALVTKAATTIFGEAGVSAATGVMTVAILLLTEITPKSIAVHNATEVARFVVRPVAWLSLVLYPVGRVVTFLSMGMLKMLGLKGRSEPYVTEDELKLMLRGAELSGAIEEEEQRAIPCFKENLRIQ